MRKLIVFCTVIVTVAVLSNAQIQQEWYKPFSTTGRSFSVYETYSTGNYIWFFSDNGFGSFNTVTQKFDYFTYDLFDVPFSLLQDEFTLGDSAHIALYSKRGAFILYYNGHNWINLPVPEGIGGRTKASADNRALVCADNSGTLWAVINKNDLSKYENDSWSSVTTGFPDSTVITSLIVDTAKTLRLLVKSETATQESFLYRFRNDSLEKISDQVVDAIYMKYANNTVLLVGESTISMISPDETIRTLRDNLGDFFPYQQPTIDTDGNLWYMHNKQLIKYDVQNANIIWSLDKEFRRNLLTCNNGIYLIESDNIYHFPDNDSVYTVLSKSSMWDNTCGSPTGSLLFRKDSSFLAFPSVTGFSIGMSNSIFTYKNGGCAVAFPTPDFEITSIWELADGRVVLSRHAGGLYEFDGTSWQVFEGTENIWCFSVIQDKMGVIWATTSTSIIRQTGPGWELINDGNSNLPPFGSAGIYGINQLVEDSSGAVWLFASGNFFIAKTTDGYNWTVYDTINSNVFSESPLEPITTPESEGADAVLVRGDFLGMAISNEGSIELDYIKPLDCPDSECVEIIRVTDNGTANWNIKTISVPAMPGFDYPLYLRIHRDSKGGFWILGNRNDDYTVYHNLRGSTNWIKYEYSDNPFKVVDYLGEDGEGKTYFRDLEEEIVVFNPDPGLIDPNPVIQPLRQTEKISHLEVRMITSGRISVDFSLPKTATVSISLISLNGRKVTQLHNSKLDAGSHRNSYPISAVPGIYLVHLQTSDIVQSSRIFIR